MIKAAMLETVRVRDVMTEALLLLRAEMPVDEAWEQLHAAGVAGSLVLDGHGRPAGFLSNADLADPRRRNPRGGDRVSDLMTRLVYAVRADDAVHVAVRLMADENIHHVVAVNDDGSLAGIIAPMDILRVLLRGVTARVDYVDLRKLDKR
jgi:CBS-domain-containing membrane protein